MTEAASYLTLEPGTPVRDRLGAPVGELRRVLVHHDGRFDGLLVKTGAGRRFVDAPEVRNVCADRIELAVTRDEVEDGDPTRPDAPLRWPAKLRRALRLPDRVPAARQGKTLASEADRRAAVVALKRSYMDDQIDDDRLGELVGRAHEASTVAALEQLLRDARAS